jgi:hypothetical protein
MRRSRNLHGRTFAAWEAVMIAERRQSERKRMLKRGRIVFRNGFASIDCVVLDLSAGGAKVRTSGFLVLPERFELRIENGPSCPVEVAFRGADVTGVRFLPAAA